MSHDNRRQVRLPRRLIDEIAQAMRESIRDLERSHLILCNPHMAGPDDYDYARKTIPAAQRALSELKRRLRAIDRETKEI